MNGLKNKLPLTQFFRDAKTGHMALELINKRGKSCQDEICPVVKVQSKSVILQRREGLSQLDLDYASLIDYNGSFLDIYAIGKSHTERGYLMLRYKVHKV